MTLRLHYAPDNASLCVRLALEAGGFAYETVLVDRAARGQKAPAYLALNPNGLIPVLETPGGPVFETGAILLWLADRVPGALFPAPADPDRGAALSWLFWMSNTLHPTLRMCFYPELYGPDPAIVRAAALDRLCAHFDVIEAVPAAFASPLARCYLAPMLRWAVIYAHAAPPVDPARWPRLHAMARAFEQTPAARTVARAEGLGDAPYSAPHLPDPPEGSAL